MSAPLSSARACFKSVQTASERASERLSISPLNYSEWYSAEESKDVRRRRRERAREREREREREASRFVSPKRKKKKKKNERWKGKLLILLLRSATSIRKIKALRERALRGGETKRGEKSV